MKITAVLILFAFFAGAKVYGRYSLHDGGHTLKYNCRENEDLEVYYPDHMQGNPDIISLVISSCNSANLTNYMGANLELTLTSIIVENIKNMVEFAPALYSLHLKDIELLNIGEIPKFEGHTTFQRFNKLDRFHIENTIIGEFDQSFNGVEVKVFRLKKVMILNLRVLEFSSLHGEHLEIIDSFITVNLLTPNDSLNFEKFDRITIENTTFIFPNGGNISISGREIHLSNNVLFNARINVVGEKIRVHDTCADGPSSTMRLHLNDSGGHRHGHHDRIVSERNSLPSGIIYAPHHKHHGNNTVCPNARCDCLFMKPNIRPGSKHNFANSYHDNSRGFFLYFIIIASAILTRI